MLLTHITDGYGDHYVDGRGEHTYGYRSDHWPHRGSESGGEREEAAEVEVTRSDKGNHSDDGGQHQGRKERQVLPQAARKLQESTEMVHTSQVSDHFCHQANSSPSTSAVDRDLAGGA
ncbi:hypothetical protein ACFU8Q_31235 [Streptomyces sp. NPDC057543]|uniref:hypothetical protein n=1 Tax=Streptomyces sp. NPDC057543 TaxID=3346163 RepID=UPI003679C8C5